MVPPNCSRLRFRTVVRIMTTSNIVLTGFMGTGKSAVGRILADTLDWEFVDTDDVIEQRYGPIADIFADQGEATFRRFERELAHEISGCANHVIATGGGLMLDSEASAALARNSAVYCLTADPDEIVRRLMSRSKAHRPLLDSPDQPARIIELLTERAAAYGEFEQVATDDLSTDEVVAHITRLWEIAHPPEPGPGSRQRSR